MTPLILLLWLCNIVFDSVGQLAFKAAALKEHPSQGMDYWLFIARQPMIWLGVSCYLLEFLLWLAFLSLVPLSNGVILGSINIVTLMLAGRLFFGEKLTPWRLAGMALVAMGVAVVGVNG